MNQVSNRDPALALSAAVLAAGVLMALDQADLLRLGWSWAVALACLTAGLGLLTVAPSSSAQYVGTLTRIAGPRRTTLWGARAATVVTAPVAGIGPAAYAGLSLVHALAEEPGADGQPDWRRSLGTGLLGLSYVVAADAVGFQVGSDPLLWGVLLGSAGLSAYWWAAGSIREHRKGALALAGIAALLWFAVGAVGTSGGRSGELIAAVAAGAGLAVLVLAPRWVRRSRALAAERVESARANERLELAGVVHDSVLQTLALIQSRADDPAEVKALARRQERDLRARLFGGPEAQPLSMAGALRSVAAEVEDAHRVKIDVVIIGDARLDEDSAALVASAREALFNAAKHATDAPVSLFAEIDERQVSAYVRDRGPGFDLETIPQDRRGVRDSIMARMVRHGGHAAVRTAPGGGCEVRLVQERRR
jgi:signal transduction histidine kinase